MFDAKVELASEGSNGEQLATWSILHNIFRSVVRLHVGSTSQSSMFRRPSLMLNPFRILPSRLLPTPTAAKLIDHPDPLEEEKTPW
jgi:hypothetical protein